MGYQHGNLGLGIEVGVGKLLALTQRRLNDLEPPNIGSWVVVCLVWIRRLRSGLLLWPLSARWFRLAWRRAPYRGRRRGSRAIGGVGVSFRSLAHG